MHQSPAANDVERIKVMSKFAWIAKAIKEFPAVLPAIAKHPLPACALMMFIIALVSLLR